VVILTRPDTGIKSTADLAGKKVGAQTGSAAETAGNAVRERFEKDGKGFTIKSYQQTADELLDLQNQRVDAVLASRPVVVNFIQKSPDKFLMAGLLGEPAYAAWLFRQGDVGGEGCIGTEINKVLSTLKAEGYIAALQRKWIGSEFPLPNY
jgi:polar amino acid transport system substrate-binding protein